MDVPLYKRRCFDDGNETRSNSNKLCFVIQIMKGVNGILGNSEAKTKDVTGLEQFVMPVTERGQKADEYVKGAEGQ